MNDTMTIELPTTARMLACCAGIAADGHPLQTNGSLSEHLGTDAGATDTPNHFKSDIGSSDAFVKRHAANIRFCADEKTWLVFSDEAGWLATRHNGGNQFNRGRLRQRALSGCARQSRNNGSRQRGADCFPNGGTWKQKAN